MKSLSSYVWKINNAQLHLPKEGWFITSEEEAKSKSSSKVPRAPQMPLVNAPIVWKRRVLTKGDKADYWSSHWKHSIAGGTHLKLCVQEVERFPSSIKKKAFKVDNCCSLWMTCPNINLWFDGSKRTLIQHGLKKRQAAAGERHWWWP